MQTVFVTGASGFIGKRVVAELVRRGIPCRCLVRATSNLQGLQGPLVELVQGAVHEPESYARALDGVDTVVHLAGLTHALHKTDLYQINADACGALADVCRRQSEPPKLVYISSIAAAGPPPLGKPLRDESDPASPLSDYGRSKRQGELELQQRAGELPITILRPGVVYGPADKKLAEMLRSIYRWHLHVVVGFRTPQLSLIHVDDLVQLVLTAAERGETLSAADGVATTSQGFYSACDDREFPTYWEFGQRVARVMDRWVFVWPLWRWVGRSVALTVETGGRLRQRPTFLTVDKVREAVASSWACSAHKARSQLNFMPSATLDEHLRETVHWYIDNDWL